MKEKKKMENLTKEQWLQLAVNIEKAISNHILRNGEQSDTTKDIYEIRFITHSITSYVNKTTYSTYDYCFTTLQLLINNDTLVKIISSFKDKIPYYLSRYFGADIKLFLEGVVQN